MFVSGVYFDILKVLLVQISLILFHFDTFSRRFGKFFNSFVSFPSFVEWNIRENRKDEVDRIVQYRSGPVGPAVELDAGDSDVEYGGEVEEGEQSQGSYQAGLGEG